MSLKLLIVITTTGVTDVILWSYFLHQGEHVLCYMSRVLHRPFLTLGLDLQFTES